MRVLFSSTSGWGHVNPMLPLAVAMRDRGNETIFASAEDARPRIEAAGFRMVVAGQPMAARMAEFRRRWPEVASLSGPAQPALMFPRLFGDVTAPPHFDDLRPFAAEWQPSVVVHDAADLAAPIVASELAIPHVTHSFGTLVPKANVAAATEWTEPLWRKVGSEPPPFNGCYEHLYLDIFPPSMQAPGDRSYLGRVERLRPATPRTDQELPPAIAGPIGESRPVVYLTFGTIFNVNDAFAHAVEAIARCDELSAVVTVGPGGDVDAFGRLPKHVQVAHYVPQDALLPHCSAVISHAGSGTLLGAFARGIPQVCLPQAADQFRNAEAAASAGAGVALIGDEATTDAIEAALRQVLTDAGVRQRAEALQEEIAAMPSPARVAGVIERLRR